MTLEIRGLKRDLGDKVVLTDINLTVNKGDIVFVRGPSGVGKSLLLRAIACLDCVQVIAEL
jgi:ABC-type sugar transport system ATPase subunit